MAYPGTEVQGRLYKAGSCTLDATGNGSITLDPENARQRWEVTAVTVSTNQAATAVVVPVATVAKNTVVASQLSQANNHGQSWSGNQDTFSGQVDVSSGDFLSILFTPPPGATSGQVATLSGVTCYATVTGQKFTRVA